MFYLTSVDCIICGTITQVPMSDANDPDTHVCGRCAAQKVVRGLSGSAVSTANYEFEMVGDWVYVDPNAPKCVCGAKAAGIAWHSDYCPLYENPMGKDNKGKG